MSAGRTGRLLAAGRDAEIYEHGPGLVLRRTRDGRSMATEARVMEYARSRGYPVPAVDGVSDDGTELVMERLDGVSMVDAMLRRPWTMRAHGTLLADLHRRLHEIEAPEWLPPAPGGGDDGDRLLHLDLHPLNVLVTATGPVVIDWTGATRGAPAFDVALTWAVIVSGEPPAPRLLLPVLRRIRSVFVGGFVAGIDRDAARARLADAVAWKTTDPHMSVVECDAMRRLVAAVE